MQNDSFKDFALDQLSDIGPVECRAMFGGYGLYCGKVFFGILYKGKLYFKTNEKSRTDYKTHGMKPFRPGSGPVLKNYYEVPVHIFEDREACSVWARRAVQIARSG